MYTVLKVQKESQEEEVGQKKKKCYLKKVIIKLERIGQQYQRNLLQQEQDVKLEIMQENSWKKINFKSCNVIKY